MVLKIPSRDATACEMNSVNRSIEMFTLAVSYSVHIEIELGVTLSSNT